MSLGPVPTFDDTILRLLSSGPGQLLGPSQNVINPQIVPGGGGGRIGDRGGFLSLEQRASLVPAPTAPPTGGATSIFPNGSEFLPGNDFPTPLPPGSASGAGTALDPQVLPPSPQPRPFEGPGGFTGQSGPDFNSILDAFGRSPTTQTGTGLGQPSAPPSSIPFGQPQPRTTAGFQAQPTQPLGPPPSSQIGGGPAFGGDNPNLGPPASTGGAPFVEPPAGTQFSPDFQFAVDPDNPDSSASFINALLSALGPGLASGQFSNFQTQPGATGNQSQQTATNLFNQLGGGNPFRTLLRNSGASALANPLGEQTPSIQGFLEQQLRSQIEGGGVSNQFVNAARERILGPAQEALLGRLNRQGGGVASLDSPLFQELQRKQEADFANDLILFGGSNLQNSLSQAGQLGAQQFGQGFSNRQFGAGAQGQLAGQSLDLGSILSQFGLGQQGLDLQNQGQRNQFGLGQSEIGSDILQTLLAGREGGGALGTILSILSASGGGSGINDLLGGLFGEGGIFNRNPSEGGTTEGGTPDINPQGGGTPNITPRDIWDILFPEGFGDFNPFPDGGPDLDPRQARNEDECHQAGGSWAVGGNFGRGACEDPLKPEFGGARFP